MKKRIEIEGMMCAHCQAHVQQALERLPGVTAVTVSLEDKCAVVTCSENVTDAALQQAVTDAGYQPGAVAAVTV